jgi:hypothetical protein
MADCRDGTARRLNRLSKNIFDCNAAQSRRCANAIVKLYRARSVIMPAAILIAHDHFGRRFARFPDHARERGFMLSTVLIIVLILLLLGALPTWPYSSGWGYYPGGGLGLILIIVVVLALTGRI